MWTDFFFFWGLGSRNLFYDNNCKLDYFVVLITDKYGGGTIKPARFSRIFHFFQQPATSHEHQDDNNWVTYP